MVVNGSVDSNEFMQGSHAQEADHCTFSFIYAKAAVAISRNQYVCGWRVQWGIYILVLKICLKINVLSIVLAEAQGFEPWEDFHPRRFSRPVHSTTLPSLRCGLLSGTFLIRKGRSFIGEIRRQNVSNSSKMLASALVSVQKQCRRGKTRVLSNRKVRQFDL